MKRSDIAPFLKEMNASFAAQVEELQKRGLLKKKQVEDMKAGCSDGARMTLLTLIEKGTIKVEED